MKEIFTIYYTYILYFCTIYYTWKEREVGRGGQDGERELQTIYDTYVHVLIIFIFVEISSL